MIGTDGSATLIVTALTGASFAAALVLTILIGRRFHRDWRSLAASGPPAWVETGRNGAGVLARDAERRRMERAGEDARLHRLRTETEAWQERLNGLQQQAIELDRRFQEIAAVKAEVACAREEEQAIRRDMAAARAELEARSREDAVRAEQAAAVHEGLEQDRQRATDLAAAIAEGLRQQAELSRAEAESRSRLETVRAELARCLADQDTLRLALEARRLEVEAMGPRGLSPAALPLPVPAALPRPVPADSEEEALGSTPEPPEPPVPAIAPVPVLPAAPVPAAPRWTVSGQSVVKPRNDSFSGDGQIVWRRNEDRFRLSEREGGLLAAVSDGAGASGLFCGAWAGALVGRLPDDHPLTGMEDVNGWLEGFCHDFHREFAGRARTDPRKHSKFVREGSFATLAACWLDRSGTVPSCRWLAYGDSPVLVFERSGESLSLIAGHPDSLTAFDRDPQLLNWKTLPTPAALRTGEIVLPPRATIVLASDGIGQFILLRYLAALQAGGSSGTRSGMAGDLLAEFRHLVGEAGSRVGAAAAAHLARPVASFAEDMAGLGDALSAESSFAALVGARCEEGLLANDDATLILINLDSSEATLGPDAVDQP